MGDVKEKTISDTNRLNWLIANQTLVRIGGQHSTDPYYFLVYPSGDTSDSWPSPRQAIDAAIEDA